VDDCGRGCSAAHCLLRVELGFQVAEPEHHSGEGHGGGIVVGSPSAVEDRAKGSGER
jgi:hypothetical protein